MNKKIYVSQPSLPPINEYFEEFCFVGFYNGIGKTRFVMMQGTCGAFMVRVPL